MAKLNLTTLCLCLALICAVMTQQASAIKIKCYLNEINCGECCSRLDKSSTSMYLENGNAGTCNCKLQNGTSVELKYVWSAKGFTLAFDDV